MEDAGERAEQTRVISRRTTVAGMAFAVPTIMGVGAAPAMAASAKTATYSVAGKVITVTIRATHPQGSDTATLISMTGQPQPNLDTPSPFVTKSLSTGEATFAITFKNAGNGMKNYTLTYQVDSVRGTVVTDTLSLTY